MYAGKKTHVVNKIVDDWRITPLFIGIQRPISVINSTHHSFNY